jgi:hypothetical protein
MCKQARMMGMGRESEDVKFLLGGMKKTESAEEKERRVNARAVELGYTPSGMNAQFPRTVPALRRALHPHSEEAKLHPEYSSLKDVIMEPYTSMGKTAVSALASMRSDPKVTRDLKKGKGKRAPAGPHDGRRKRAEIVKKVMAEKGIKMIEASKYVKEHGLY